MPSINVPLFRGDEELDLEVDFVLDPADPSVGLGSSIAPSCARVYSRSERAWVEIELSEREWDRVVVWIDENWEEEGWEDE